MTSRACRGRVAQGRVLHHEKVGAFAEVPPIEPRQRIAKRFQPLLVVQASCAPSPGRGHRHDWGDLIPAAREALNTHDFEEANVLLNDTNVTSTLAKAWPAGVDL